MMRKLSSIVVIGLGLVFTLTSYSPVWAQNVMDKVTTYYTPLQATEWDSFELSGLMGGRFWTSEGRVMGNVSDFVVDFNNHRVSDIVISDVVGRGAEQVAIPYGDLVKSGPALSYGVPGDQYTLYGEGRYDHLPVLGSLGEKHYRATDLIGKWIRTNDGETAGQITDFVVDSRTGHLIFVVLGDGGGIPYRTLAVPSNLISASGQMFVLNTTAGKLASATEFMWPGADRRAAVEEVYRYYGLQPYWEMKE